MKENLDDLLTKAKERKKGGRGIGAGCSYNIAKTTCPNLLQINTSQRSGEGD